MPQNNNSFYYSYSAERQKEINRIVAKYTDDKESKYQQLVRLDDSVESFATTIAIIYAIVSVLVFGGGLSLVLAMNKALLGSIVATCGIFMMFFIHTVRKFALTRRRRLLKNKIIRLAQEITGRS